jgi:hypothetical protein
VSGGKHSLATTRSGLSGASNIEEKLGTSPAGRAVLGSDAARRIERGLGGPLPGVIKCLEICTGDLIGPGADKKFPFDASADVNRRVCDNLVEAFNGESAGGDPIDDVAQLIDPTVFGRALSIDRRQLCTPESLFTQKANGEPCD